MAVVNIHALAYDALRYIRSVCPWDTGTMHDAIDIDRTARGVYEITIGSDPATYAVYTNEPWIADRWNGKPNPNEHWIDKGVLAIVETIARAVGGRVESEGEIERWFNQNYDNAKTTG